MIKDKSVDVLNSLIMLNNDRIAGYKVAINETKDEDLKCLINQSIQTSRDCKSELTAEVERLGGQPDDMTRVNGKIFRSWMDFKTLVLRKDRRALLGSCEYGEYVALNSYEKALLNENLDATFIPMVAAQHRHLKMDHEKIVEMRAPLMTA
jgi:uncharacterized protein (TIGR02284 family)